MEEKRLVQADVNGNDNIEKKGEREKERERSEVVGTNEWVEMLI